ncbi:MAG: glycosyltransferase [Acidobacteriota bacterium]
MNKTLASPFVSVVVRTRNRKEYLDKCIDSILDSTHENYEVIVVDDNSEDGTTEFLSRNYLADGKVRALAVKRRKSTAQLYNVGLEHSKGEIVAFVDDDCVVERSWLNEISRPLVSDKSVMAVGGVSYIGRSRNVYAPGRISGCNMAFRKDAFRRFSFDPWLVYSHFYDELDLINRMKDRGLRAIITSKAVVYHFTKYSSLPAAEILGGHLNCLYSLSKGRSLRDYYALPVSYAKKRRERADPGLSLEGAFKSWMDMVLARKNPVQLLRALCLFMLEIPVKSRIRRSVEERLFKKNHVATPRYITFFITSRCNSNCRHCFLRNLNNGTADMRESNILKIADSLSKPSDIILTGGETLMRDDLTTLLGRLASHEKIASIAITTNGFLPERIAALEPAICRSIKHIHISISLDGLEETHNKIRGVPSAFKNAVESCRIARCLSLKYRNLSLAANIVLMKDNIDEIAALVGFLLSNGFPSLLTPVRGNSFSSFNLDKDLEVEDYGPKTDNSLTVDEIEAVVSALSEKYPRYFQAHSKRLMDLILSTLRSRKRQIRCYAGYEGAIVYNDGSVAVCEQLKPFGNLQNWNYDLSIAWNSEEAAGHRRRILNCACVHACSLSNSIEIERSRHPPSMFRRAVSRAHRSLAFP